MAAINIFHFSLLTKSNLSTPSFKTSFSIISSPRSMKDFSLISLNRAINIRIIRSLSIHRSDDKNISTSNSTIEALRVVLAAGDTGGHVYPAVAIADELLLAYPKAQILFLGTPTSMESAAVPSAGYEFDTVPATQFSRSPISPQNLLFPLHLIESVVASYQKLVHFKSPISERALRVSKPNASTEIVQHIGSLINLSTKKTKQQ